MCQKRHDLYVYHDFTKNLLGDVILIVAYLINRMQLNTLNFQSLLKALKGENEYIVPPKCLSLSALFTRGILENSILVLELGYSPTQKEYKCYQPPSEDYFDITPLTPQGENNKEEETILVQIGEKSGEEGE